MLLFLHLTLHILTGVIAGYIVWMVWKNPLPVFSMAFIGGVLIDLDHFIDYFLAFGWQFRLEYFLKGYQFLASDKIYIFFHGWEYVILLSAVAWLVKGNVKIKAAVLALALGMFFHLSIDVFTNEGAQLKTYSIIYRAKNNFDLKALVTQEHYQDHQIRKKLINFLRLK